MHNKVFLTAFGLIVAGITGATSIAAATHPERVAELRHVVFGETSGAGDEAVTDARFDTQTSADLESVRPSGGTQAAIDHTQASRDAGNSVSDHRRSKNSENEREDGDDDDGDDDARGGSASGSVQTVTPQPTPTTPAPTQKTFTMAQVAAHHTSSDCYTAINGIVYDLTPFIHSHPGGVSAISQLCDIDGAALFQAQHGGQGKPEQELASLKIGALVQ